MTENERIRCVIQENNEMIARRGRRLFLSERLLPSSDPPAPRGGLAANTNNVAAVLAAELAAVAGPLSAAAIAQYAETF